MSFANWLDYSFDLWVNFFGSDFFQIFGLGFLGFFSLIAVVKVVWYVVRFNK